MRDGTGETDLPAAEGSHPAEGDALPCRALVPRRALREALARDATSVGLPARTRALVTGGTSGFGAVDAAVIRWAHARTRKLVAKLLHGEVRVDEYRQDVAALTGLGPGLTPTGDDLLVGLAAMARRLASGGLVEPRAASAFAASLAGLAGADTTPVALELLANASRGLFPTALANVVERLGDPAGDSAVLRERLARLVETGAHSGADLLAGALSLVRGVLDAKETR